jgi:hypothetical protein
LVNNIFYPKRNNPSTQLSTMKSVAAVALLSAGVASAFAPLGSAPRTAAPALQMSKLDSAFGVGIETGNKCPPVGAWILEDAQDSALAWFQNAEIKHGRIAMVATLGFINQKAGVHFPLYFGPTGSNAFHPESADSWLLSSTTGVTFSDIAHAAPLEAIKVWSKRVLLELYMNVLNFDWWLFSFIC